MPKPSTEKATEEQATEALQQLTLLDGESEPEPAPAPQAAPEPERTPEPEAEPTEAETAGEGDDVASLKKRYEDLQAKTAEDEKRFQARLQAHQQRSADNERILRERHLRKSTAADNALKILKASRTQEGVPEADVERAIREIEGTMHPASASHVPPSPVPAVAEDQAIILNGFLNEKGMTGDEADEFGRWIRSEGVTALSPGEQAVAGQSLDGFLRIAHSRWQEGMREKDRKAQHNDTVDAVRSVQRTQREAARAASASPTAPRKQPAAPKTTVDIKKLTKDDIATLLRQSVEQYE